MTPSQIYLGWRFLSLLHEEETKHCVASNRKLKTAALTNNTHLFMS